MSGGRILVVAVMHGRMLLRRRLTMVLLVALPLALYLTAHGGDLQIEFGGLGLAWAIGGVSMFTLLAGRRVDPCLVLGGHRPAELLLGRLVLLEGVGLALAVLFWLVMYAGNDPPRPGLLLLALALTTFVAVPMGFAIAAVVPGELEGVLVLIGIVGIAMVLEDNSVLHPLYGSRELLDTAAMADRDPDVTQPLLHLLGVAGGLWSVSVVRWMARVRLRITPTADAAQPGSESFSQEGVTT